MNNVPPVVYRIVAMNPPPVQQYSFFPRARASPPPPTLLGTARYSQGIHSFPPRVPALKLLCSIESARPQAVTFYGEMSQYFPGYFATIWLSHVLGYVRYLT